MIATTLPELGEKKAVNFVLLLLFGSAKPKSSLFLARGGASRAPMPPLPIGATVSYGPSLLPGESAICVSELSLADQVGAPLNSVPPIESLVVSCEGWATNLSIYGVTK